MFSHCLLCKFNFQCRLITSLSGAFPNDLAVFLHFQLLLFASLHHGLSAATTDATGWLGKTFIFSLYLSEVSVSVCPVCLNLMHFQHTNSGHYIRYLLIPFSVFVVAHCFDWWIERLIVSGGCPLCWEHFFADKHLLLRSMSTFPVAFPWLSSCSKSLRDSLAVPIE